MASSKIILLGLAVSAVAADLPAITAAPQLHRRQTDPAFVGLVGDQFADTRSCDFPQTVSTSGSFIQCCPKTGSCPFYTSCSSNILVASNTTVPCDADSALACNTGLVVTADNDLNTGSYLACWQTSLGTTPFSILQDPDATSTSGQGSASGGAAASGTQGSSTSEETSSSASETSSGSGSSSRTSDAGASGASETSSSSAAAIAGISEYRRGGLIGALMFVAQMIL